MSETVQPQPQASKSNRSTGSSSTGRSRLEQSAILLLSIGEEAAAMVMQKLSREEVIRVSEASPGHR